MKSFVRCVWGAQDLYPEGNLFRKNLGSLQREIQIVMQNKHMGKKFVTYVLGQRNYDFLTDKGLDCVLVNKKDALFDPIKRIWLHKIYLIGAAMQDFDEIVYMDWDTQPFKPIPGNFWDTLRQKDTFQAPLYKYSSIKMPHRGNRWASKVLPSGAFIYMADKSIPDKLMKYEHVETLRDRWLDEIYYGAYTDDQYGGWKNTDFYREHFEPEWCNIRKGVYKKENNCFGHPKTRVIK